MRIVSGIYKGRRFNPPKNLPVRPTTDFAKEGLFNILRNRIELKGSHILDLFSGSGNISLEFASREAASIRSIDANRNCLLFLEKVAKDLSIDSIHTRKSDVLEFLKKDQGHYDLIFADPPYAFDRSEEMVDLILSKGLLHEDCYLILEHGKDQNFEEHPAFEFSRKFGNVNFTFFVDRSK